MASSKVKGCRHGWVDFTLKYPDTKEDYQTIKIANPRKFTLQSNETNVWRTNTSLNVYHDKMNKSVRVIIKQLEEEDNGDYRFGFKPKNETITVTLEDGRMHLFNPCCISKHTVVLLHWFVFIETQYG